MRTYITGAHAFVAGSTDLVGSDVTIISRSARCVLDDCEVSKHEVKTDGAAVWEM
jgi:hypothetical protein